MKIPTPRSLRRAWGRVAPGLLAAGFVLAACAGPAPGPSTATATTESNGTATPTSVLENSTPVPVATADVSAQTLRLWLPPHFAPSESTPGGRALLAQLAAFEKTQGWHVDVRVKKVSGQGGLIDALNTSLEVAPGVSPDVVALDTTMLSFAAGSIQPLEQISEGEVVDYYPFTLQAAQLESTLVAMPFAVDALGFVYSTTAYGIPPQSWNDLKPESGAVYLPLDDPVALVTLQQYVALGGDLSDSTGQPTLDAVVLAQVLADYQSLQTAGLLPEATREVASVEETWTAYREGRGSAATAYFGSYLAERRRLGATGFTFLPTRTGARATFATQWNYALVAADPSRQAIALELIRWLTTPANLGPWALAASVLPARSQALNVWSDTFLAAIGDQLLKGAQPGPSQSVLVVVGPPVRAAVRSVLDGQASPEAAAATAAATVVGR
jgi:ABC-type glycerol-3-phosphate transport system substrate-binding protein